MQGPHRVAVTAAVLVVAVGLVSVGHSARGPFSVSETHHLATIVAAVERGEFGDSAEDKKRARRGAINFFSPYPGGN